MPAEEVLRTKQQVSPGPAMYFRASPFQKCFKPQAVDGTAHLGSLSQFLRQTFNITSSLVEILPQKGS